MNQPQPNKQRRAFAALRDGGCFILLAVLIFGLHFESLDYGLFMDDYAHYQQLRECDWSVSGLTDACRLELVGGVANMWFLPECTLRFFRPVAFGLIKLTYTLTGWSPGPLHVASLTWHLAACTLLMLLLRRLGATPLLAWGLAGLFALHPGHLAPIRWIACQTELMVTVFLLAATLCYLRFRGWSEPNGWPGAPRSRYVWGLASLLLYAIALGCRENAIVFPLVMLAVEALLWRHRWRDALTLYGLFAAVAVLYLLLRTLYLHGAALPPKPYVYTPHDAGFVRFVFDKACYYLLGEFVLTPIVPFAGLYFLRDHPLTFYGSTAAVVLLLVVLGVVFRRRKPGLLAPAWLLGFMAPVLPAFASPHHLYLPGIGWAIAAMLLLRGIGGGGAAGTWLRRRTMWACLLLIGVGFGAATLAFGVPFDVAQQVENLVADEIAAAADGLESGDTLYVANLPIIAHYVRLVVEHKTGLRNLQVEVLTWAPRVLGLVETDLGSEMTWVDDRTIEVRLAGGQYFAGALGRVVGEAAGGLPPRQSDRYAAEHGFTVEVIEADEGGVMGLRFRFDRPLSDPRVHLFWGSPVRWACELRPPKEP